LCQRICTWAPTWWCAARVGCCSIFAVHLPNAVHCRIYTAGVDLELLLLLLL
jgi:hypothetical protein